ncbi:MAG: hypothetical protein EOP10_06285 [Proteobacteria bacterium]|nr:MAG: hypothetical protein EOP10_06285 [Pseudomonadota bacterium]
MKFVNSLLGLSLLLAASSQAHALSRNAGQTNQSAQQESPDSPRPILLNYTLLKTIDLATLSQNLASFGIKARNGVSIYKVSYATESLDDTSLNASGIIIIPDTKAAVFPWVSIQHGTIIAKAEAPSVAPFEGLAEASQGFVAVAADYIGYGDSAALPHPYIIAKGYQKPLVDLLRAARELANQKDFDLGPLFLKGYSEGGYATLALQKALETDYSTEFSIVASAPSAGPYNVELTGVLNVEKPVVNPVNLPFVVLAYNYWLADGQLALNDIFLPAVATVEDALSGAYNSDQVFAILPSTASGLFQSAFVADFTSDQPTLPTSRDLRALLRTQTLLDGWIPKAPTRFYHCIDDNEIPVAVTEQAVATFKAAGAPSISSVLIPSPTTGQPYLHGNCPAIFSPLQWFGEILSGKAAQ